MKNLRWKDGRIGGADEYKIFWLIHQIRRWPAQDCRCRIHPIRHQIPSRHVPSIHIWHKTPTGAPVFTEGTPLSEIFDVLKPLESETVISKGHPGSFTGTNLQEAIEKTGRKQVALVGYMAHVCVSTTARQAAERGYDVVLVKEAIGDRDIPGVKAAELVETVLKELADAFGTVVGIDEVK
jgi:nicotinamidase-related amidase